MKISVSIMTHFDRRPHAKELRTKLKSMWFEEVNIVYDTGLGEWDTGKRCLEQGIGKADWHVILQDDAIISDTFYENLYYAIINVPERNLLSLYLGKVRPYRTQVNTAFHRAMARGSSWVRTSTLLWGVGIAIPTEDIEGILENADKYPTLLYDRRIGQYYANNNRKVYNSTISLVDHNYELPSLVGHDKPGPARVCHRFVSDEVIRFNDQFIDM